MTRHDTSLKFAICSKADRMVHSAERMLHIFLKLQYVTMGSGVSLPIGQRHALLYTAVDHAAATVCHAKIP